MKIHLRKWIKSTFAASLLVGASLVQADLMVHEQILGDTGYQGNMSQAGGNTVAIDGEWAFVANVNGYPEDNNPVCQVFVYKWDPLTNKWGDGGIGYINDGTIHVGKAYTRLSYSGGSCSSTNNRNFGASLSTDNGMVAIGAPTAALTSSESYGMVYFFKFDESNVTDGTDRYDVPDNRAGWERIATVEIPQDYNTTGGLVEDKQDGSGYGSSVQVRYSTEGTGKAILIIGAPFYDVNGTVGPDAGKVYVWEWDESDGNFTLVDAEEGQYAGDQVGTTVTTNGNELLASAPYFDGNLSGTPVVDSGAVYLFGYSVQDNNFTLEHRFESGYNYNSTNIIPILEPEFHLGMTLSYEDNIIALGGTDSFVLEHNHSAGILVRTAEVNDTQEGDTSQSGIVISLAHRGHYLTEANEIIVAGSVDIHFNKYDINASKPNWHYEKNETDYGRDVSLSLPRLMVNGNDRDIATDEVTVKGAVAYAYYPTCGMGGVLKANVWQMIGLQCDITTGPDLTDTKAGVAEIFSPDLGLYDTDWIIMRQKDNNYVGHQITDFQEMLPDEPMKIGVGYWIVSIHDKTFQVNNIGLTGPIYGHTPPKELDKLDPPRDYVGGTSTLDVKAMMGGDLAIGRGDVDIGGNPRSDYRVMFSNPLIVPTDWREAIMGGGTDYYYATDLTSLFEGPATAWIYNPSTNWYIAVSTVPGMEHYIAPGQGFRVLFSNTFWNSVLNSIFVPDMYLNLAEEK